MIFTGQLGTVDSQLGQIVLGASRYGGLGAYYRLTLAPSGGVWLTLAPSTSVEMTLAPSKRARLVVRRS